jgi:5-(carboxyamino)imidazole ribonucleotide synthase
MKRIGVIGGGQLAWMMASAATELGIELVIQTPHATDVAVGLATATVLAEVDNVAATAMLAAKCDVITFENEFVNLAELGKLAADGVCFRPSLSALAPLLDKYTQRCYLRNLGLPVPQFDALETVQLPRGFSFPIVVKARRNGYDGQGTFIIKDKSALESLYHRYPDTPFLIEEFIKFDRELAVIAARGVTGEIVVYPILETQQEEQVCRRVFTWGDLPASITETCDSIARQLLASLDVIGLLAIELFTTPDGKVLVNEIAPRTHNSGHLTIEACATSQFSQILRAVAGLPLGSTELTCGSAVMVNLLGYEDIESDYLAQRQQIAAIPNTHIHWYGKTQSRIGRKLGHVTILLDSPAATRHERNDRQQAEALAKQVESIWYVSN